MFGLVAKVPVWNGSLSVGRWVRFGGSVYVSKKHFYQLDHLWYMCFRQLHGEARKVKKPPNAQKRGSHALESVYKNIFFCELLPSWKAAALKIDGRTDG